MSDSIIPVERIEGIILQLRGEKIILDEHIAALYGESVVRLNQAVARNADRFPDDFMFQLTSSEVALLRNAKVLRETEGKGGRRYAPYAFTEHGVAMLASVLRSPRAVQVNIEIVRTFVRLRRILASHAELSHRLDELEARYDKHFRRVFDAIRELMTEDEHPRREIGFRRDPSG